MRPLQAKCITPLRCSGQPGTMKYAGPATGPGAATRPDIISRGANKSQQACSRLWTSKTWTGDKGGGARHCQ